MRAALLRAFLAALFVLVALEARAIVEIDQPAPALKGTLLSGDRFDLAAYKGKVVLVNFYSSYCRHCALEIGSIETYRDDMKDRGFEVLVIAIDRAGDKDRVAHALSTYNLQGAMAAELEESGFERSYPTPTAFVIDREGIVRARLWGAKTLPRMRELMTPFLGK
ncbi:MAG: TlpA family protein disulfide reductase [Burkholderiales bacterium]|nr:TlpA family protein disulfide reductase [Burkholderiales bacterium]